VEDLSPLLRCKVALAVNDSFLRKLPIFQVEKKDESMAQSMFILELALSMKMVCYTPFEVVIEEGDIGSQMYFIVRGAVEITVKSVRLKILTENAFFGESGVMNKVAARSATVRTVCFTELRELSHEDLDKSLEKCPSMKERIFTLSKVAKEQKGAEVLPGSGRRSTGGFEGSPLSTMISAKVSDVSEITSIDEAAMRETLGQSSRAGSAKYKAPSPLQSSLLDPRPMLDPRNQPPPLLDVKVLDNKRPVKMDFSQIPDSPNVSSDVYEKYMLKLIASSDDNASKIQGILLGMANVQKTLKDIQSKNSRS